MRERGIPQEFIENVKNANNIVTVAGRYFPLKQKGRTYWANCPFHHEKTPSFAINELQQYYHCFGCGVSGNVVGLVMQVESVGYLDAIALLAKWAGMEMPAVSGNDDYLKNAKKKQRILEALDAARQVYCENLYKEQGASALAYLRKRGITDELIKMFNLGVSTDWNEVLNTLVKAGFRQDELVEAGVAVRNERGNVYDAMAHRITFPIFDIYGNCIGFTGRTLSAEKDVAKYRNTAQTMVFDKGSIVYGIDVLKKNKLANFVDKLIVVEGNVDVISLVGAGFPNTVACMGTAMTQFHARIFKRFSDQIYVCFDGDAAGQKATLRGLDILSKENLKVRVISLPPDTDPDDFVKKEGKPGFERLIEEAKPLIDFKLDHLEATGNLKDSLGKTEYLRSAIEVLSGIKDAPELELYIPKVARVSGVSFDAITRSVRQKSYDSGALGGEPPGPNTSYNASGSPTSDAGHVSAECSGARSAYALSERFVTSAVLNGLPWADAGEVPTLKNQTYQKILDLVKEHKKDGKVFRAEAIFDILGDEETGQAAEVIEFENFRILSDEPEAYWRDCVATIRRGGLQARIEELKHAAAGAALISEQTAIAKELLELTKQLNNK